MKYLYAFLFLLLYTSGFSQILSPTVITTAGDDYSNQYAKMSVTIGEPVTETISSNGTTLTQGFQQGNYSVVGIEESLMNGITANVYPNPVRNTMNIEINGTTENILVNLVDVNGKSLLNENYENTNLIHSIDFSKYSTGHYFLKLSLTNSKSFKTVKIVKIDK